MAPWTMIAAISAESLLYAVLGIVIVGVIFGLIHWLISYVGVPEPFAKVARVVLAVVAVVFLVNVLLSLVGHPFITW